MTTWEEQVFTKIGFKRKFPYSRWEGTFVAPPRHLYFEVSQGARKGSIGKLIGVSEGAYWSRSWKFNLEFDQKKKAAVIHCKLDWLKGYNGPAKYCFIKGKGKVLKPLVNRFGQTLNIGDLVVSSRHDVIVIGEIVRRTAANIYVKPYGPFVGRRYNTSYAGYNTGSEIKIANFKEAIVLPENSEFKKDLFDLVLTADYAP